MSPDRIRSPCFASQLGFSSICAILWVTFWLHRSEETLWLLVQQDKKGMSLKVFESCLASLCISPLFIESCFSKLNLKFLLYSPTLNWNIIYTIFFFFIIWQVRRSPETECFFSSSAILKPALLHTTNRKATNSSGCLAGPHPVLSLCSHHTHERQELDCCSLIKQHVQHI